MIDIGVNLLHPQFDADREAVIRRATAAGVEEMLITCTDLEMTEAAIEYCDAQDMFCTAGVHPHDARHAPDDLRERLQSLAGSTRVKAIGETGLDFNRNYSPQSVQRSVFRTQLEVAENCGLPLFIHDRDSDGATFQLLNEYASRAVNVVIHCFTGTAADLERYLSIGCAIGITGWICDRRRGAELRKLVVDIPLDRILIETDAPFLRPHNAPADEPLLPDKRRNEPSLLPYVVAQIAAEKLMEPADIERASTENARRLFDLPDRT